MRKKREHLHTVGRNTNCYSHYGKQYGGASLNKERAIPWLYPSLGASKGKETGVALKRHLCSHINYRDFYNGQDLAPA